MHYDVFNGDADGIIALLQLRLAEPKESQLVTGIKRDIKLLDQVNNANDATSVTVLDISMEKNTAALQALLKKSIGVFYCDHHRCGDIPNSPHLTALINLDSEVCTGLLINEYLNGQFFNWAITAAFGDNLISTAQDLAKTSSLTPDDIEFLKELGTLINYNGYGASLDDLHIAPDQLFRQLLNYKDPLLLKGDKGSPYYQLKRGYNADYKELSAISPIFENETCRVFELPNQPWARRISGVFGNQLANQKPEKAHAVLTLNSNKSDYTVSVRAPLENRIGADEVCGQFATGGGRKAAAGINALPLNDKHAFVTALNSFYQ
ncbi:DHH family phosphoesterase [Vibrio sp. T187]|uniref:DHH family phosphoesterase n=1 Tax=Vibrio TaxID=662 RepID=UPI0010CA0C53|nr:MULTISPECIES: DHH family phosphoesterase [Vibrio]MBW3695884.1 DHH family phosphoesterase [Vibrio sp. T187]